MRIRLQLLIVALLSALFCVSAAENSPAVSADVSIIGLIANPEKFDGRKIRTVGVASIVRGGSAVYLSREDARAPVFRNGIALGFVGFELPEWAPQLHLKRVLVEGTFRAPPPGFRWSGTIRDITTAYSLEDVVVE